mgnify:CR=1 FL=1
MLFRSWFADPKHVPGGALIDEGIYWLDFFRWITGSEIADVEARIGNVLHKDLQVEDWGLATFTMANGVVATLEGAWTIVSPRVTAPSPKQNAVVRIEVVGNRGEIQDQFFRAPSRSVLAAGANDWVFERQNDLGPSPFEHLVDCLASGRQTIATIEDAYRAFVPAMAAYGLTLVRSTRSGQRLNRLLHLVEARPFVREQGLARDRKSTRLNSSHRT